MGFSFSQISSGGAIAVAIGTGGQTAPPVGQIFAGAGFSTELCVWAAVSRLEMVYHESMFWGDGMKYGMILAVLVLGAPAFAGPIETACNRSARQSGNPALCQCIQKVADATLAAPDQRRAAKFFTNPEKADKAWQSQSSGDDAFWARYKAFGAQAQEYCSPS